MMDAATVIATNENAASTNRDEFRSEYFGSPVVVAAMFAAVASIAYNIQPGHG